MTITLDIPDTQYADGLVAFGSPEAVIARATFHVTNEWEAWRQAAQRHAATDALTRAQEVEAALADKPEVRAVIEAAVADYKAAEIQKAADAKAAAKAAPK